MSEIIKSAILALKEEEAYWQEAIEDQAATIQERGNADNQIFTEANRRMSVILSAIEGLESLIAAPSQAVEAKECASECCNLDDCPCVKKCDEEKGMCDKHSREHGSHYGPYPKRVAPAPQKAEHKPDCVLWRAPDICTCSAPKAKADTESGKCPLCDKDRTHHDHILYCQEALGSAQPETKAPQEREALREKISAILYKDAPADDFEEEIEEIMALIAARKERES